MESQSLYNIKIDIEKYTSLRQSFHKIPEIGFKEYQTSKLILETLNQFPNFEKLSKITKVGDTGLFIDIYGTNEDIKCEPRFNIF
jgi:metal-dependent amidase/aminoacylase/carboxypeptidase family protein